MRVVHAIAGLVMGADWWGRLSSGSGAIGVTGGVKVVGDDPTVLWRADALLVYCCNGGPYRLGVASDAPGSVHRSAVVRCFAVGNADR